MSPKKGIITLMGSGELTATMVEVHKELLRRVPPPANAFFLDTPAGFELNCDTISQRAIDYFHHHVQHTLSVASYKSKEATEPYDAAQTFHKLRESNYVLIGPGSPTYAVRQWRQTQIPEILTERIAAGNCLVAASAAALTVGRFTLPVYEIYKVGEDLHWVEGMNILEHFGFNLVVIPHWNNAEGGTHDTRFCYMGETRLRKLEALLPDDVSILGLDEHTACILDLEKDEAVIRGVGNLTLRRAGVEKVFGKSEVIPLRIFREGRLEPEKKVAIPQSLSPVTVENEKKSTFWDRVHELETEFHIGLNKHESSKIINALLNLDRFIWAAQQDQESPEFISQARDKLREWIVALGAKLESAPKSRVDCITPLVDSLLMLRQEMRSNNQFEAADAIRKTLQDADISIEDTTQGSRWRLNQNP